MRKKIKWVKDPVGVILDTGSSVSCGKYCLEKGPCATLCGMECLTYCGSAEPQ